jgi:hypothetical protein
VTISGNSPDPSALGQSVKLVATASGTPNPSGFVVFTDGSTPVGVAELVSSAGNTAAALTTASLPEGDDTIGANYGGDVNYSGTTASTVSQTVETPSPPTTITVTGPKKVAPGVKYVATVSSDGSTPLSICLAVSPAAPSGMTFTTSNDEVKYKAPSRGVVLFSYVVVSLNAAGRHESSLIKVRVKS